MIPKPYILFLSLVYFFHSDKLHAQAPPNDVCTNASEIVISEDGFGLGEFTSSTSDLTEATREIGEKCSEKITDFGNCQKTVWYRFEINSTRNVSIELKQADNMFSLLNTGVTVYRSSSCENNNAGALMAGFLPILNFGISGNECLSAGTYYVQVSSRETTKRSIYLSLNVDLPKIRDYDSYKTPYFVKNTSDFNLYTQCTSIESYEASTNLPEGYTKSIWLKVPIASGLVSSSLSFRYNSETLAVRVFKSKVNEDSLESNKPFLFIGRYQSLSLYDEGCKLSSSDSVIIQVLLKADVDRFEATLSNNYPQNENVDWTSSLTPHRDTLTHSTYASRHFQKFLDCSSLLTNSHCDFIQSLYYSRQYYQLQEDVVLKYAGYVVLDMRDSGMLRVDNRSTTNSTVIYRGEVNGDCDLVEIDRNNSELTSYCVTPGLYTLVYLTQGYSQRPIAVRYDLLKVKKIPPKYYTPQTAEKLGSIDPLVGESIVSEDVYYTDEKQLIEVDGVTINEKMTFRELNMTNPGSISVQARACTFYLFKGSIAEGTAQKIDGWSYTTTYLKVGEQYVDRCLYLEKGIYTFVCVGDGPITTAACEGMSNNIAIVTHVPCSVSNSTPEGVVVLNQNRNILEICDTIQSRKSYQLYQTFCTDCYSKARNQENLGCLSEYDRQQGEYKYLTFSLPRNMSFGLGYYSSKLILYEGDIALNPELIDDESKKILNCDNGVFCNLKGGVVYTLLAYLPKRAEQSTTAIQMNFADQVATQNDFISQAIDLGSISSDTILRNGDSWISCHTNGYKDDLCFQFDNTSRFEPYNYLISFPDSINKPRVRNPKTVWYTFTTKVPCTVNLDYSFYSPGAYGPESYLIKYKGPTIDNFEDISVNGFDTSVTNFELISTSSNFFSKLLCEPGRYFIGLMEPNQNVWPKNSIVTLEVEEKKSPLPGDQCTDAIAVDVPVYGSYEVELNNYCHSYGGSPFEDDMSSAFATTWIKINAGGLDEFNIRVEVPAGFEFSLYGGDCGALTHIASSGDGYSYFTIGCLAAGNYYLQVHGSNSYTRSRLVEIEILEEKDSLCIPYDFTKPNASFTYTGGCGELRMIETHNTSTQGEDMEYYWLVNGSLIDSGFNFIFDNRASYILDNNEIGLIAINKVTKLSDTFSAIYQLDTTEYLFSISGPDSAFCFDETVLKVNTTFPYKLNYEWLDYYPLNEFSRTLIYDDTLKLLRLDTFSVYIAKAESENCHFSDTFKINFLKPFRLFEDTTLCRGEELVLPTTDDYRYIKSNYHGFFSSLDADISFSSAGKFWLEYNYKNCRNTDTFNIVFLTSESDSFLIEHCFENGLLQLDALEAQDYLWQEDESTSRFYWASEYKDYPVMFTTDNDCRDSLVFTIQNNCAFDAFVPNIFSPNSDGLNDGFKPIVKSEFERFEMEIYNRWGALIYETATSEPWNGMYGNGAVQNGVYIYKITVIEEDGTRHSENGTVMVLR